MKNIVLTGNPNCGKTTLYNALTKSHAVTGNRLGVTVEGKSGICKLLKTPCKITDTPGIYSTEAFSNEEKVAADVLKNEDYDALICVIDTPNPERSLKLLEECLKLKKPTVAALNFSDELKKSGVTADTAALKKLYGIEFVSISASKNTGLKELAEAAFNAKSVAFNPEPDALKKALNTAFPEIKKSKKAFSPDKIFTNKYAAFPLLAVFTALIFTATFSGFAGVLSNALDVFFNKTLYSHTSLLMTSAKIRPETVSLVCDGILRGLGSVVSFLPQTAVLSFLLCVFEDSGYLSRSAYICDKGFRKFGLQGKCFFCMMMGFGCSVPAIASARVLENKSDRNRTIMLIPFMSCSAKLPFYLIVADRFFNGSVLFTVFLYTLGAAVGLLYMFFTKRKYEKEYGGFLLELPEYRVPSLKSIKYSVLSRIEDFLIKAGTVLIIGSLVIWFLSSFTPRFKYTEDPNEAIAALLGEKLLFLFRPIGMTDKRQCVSLFSGLIARESIVSSLEVLYNGDISSAFTKPSALSACVFSLLFPPCFAALLTMKKELNDTKLFVKTVAVQCLLSYIISAICYRIGRFIF